MGKIIPFDWIRGLAAISILLYHFTTRYDEVIGHDPSWEFNFPYGCKAVVGFFLLSGFLTVYQLHKTTAWEYAIKRWCRLFPVYWMCIICTTLITYIGMPELTKSWKVVLINFTMLQSFFRVESVDGAYWTLAYELRFYILIFLFLWISKFLSLGKFLLLWSIACLISFFLPAVGQWHYGKVILELVLFPSRAAQFLGGCFLAYLFLGKGKIIAYMGLAISLLLQILSAEEGTDTIAFIFFFVLIAVGYRWAEFIHGYVTKCPDWVIYMLQCISFVASISYPLYLLHQYVGRVILYQLQIRGMGSEWWIFIPIGIVIILAYAIHIKLEKAAGRFSKYIVNRLR